MSVYDDDEETPPIGFEQDPEDDEIGNGTWIYADGSRKYGKGDAQMARDLADRAPSPTAETPELPSGEPLTAEERAPLEASPEEISALGGSAPEAGGTPEAPKPLAQPEQAPQAPLSAPALPGARGPARYTDKAEATDQQSLSQSNQSSVSRTGSAQSLGEFQQQQGDISRGYERQGQAQEEGANSVVAAQQDRKNALIQMAADKETVTAAAQASNEARKQQVIKKYQEVDSRKTDINQLWKDKGALGTTLGLLGVALRSLNATKFGGPNTALQSIQEQKKQAIQAQLEDRNSELRGLERELGSIEAAAPALEARMNDALAKRIDAMTVDEKSATVLANAKTMKAQLETEKASKLAESAKAYYGTLAQQQSQGIQAGRTQGTSLSRDRLSGAGIGGAGQKRLTLEQVAEADAKYEAQGASPEQRQALWRANGYDPPTGKTAAEYKRDKDASDEDGKRSEQEGKAQAAADTVSSFGMKAGLERDPKTGEWVVGDGVAPPGFWESVNPFSDNSISANAEAAVEAYGRLQSGGVIGPDERKSFREQMGLNTGNRQQLAARLNAVEKTIRARQPTGERKRGTAVPSSWKTKPQAQP